MGPPDRCNLSHTLQFCARISSLMQRTLTRVGQCWRHCCQAVHCQHGHGRGASHVHLRMSSGAAGNGLRGREDPCGEAGAAVHAGQRCSGAAACCWRCHELSDAKCVSFSRTWADRAVDRVAHLRAAAGCLCSADESARILANEELCVVHGWLWCLLRRECPLRREKSVAATSRCPIGRAGEAKRNAMTVAISQPDASCTRTSTGLSLPSFLRASMHAPRFDRLLNVHQGTSGEQQARQHLHYPSQQHVPACAQRARDAPAACSCGSAGKQLAAKRRKH